MSLGNTGNRSEDERRVFIPLFRRFPISPLLQKRLPIAVIPGFLAQVDIACDLAASGGKIMVGDGILAAAMLWSLWRSGVLAECFLKNSIISIAQNGRISLRNSLEFPSANEY